MATRKATLVISEAAAGSDEEKLEIPSNSYSIQQQILGQNSLFSKHFKDLEDEAVVGVASCALEREILWQGKLLLTHNFVCFYAQVFKKVCRLSIKWQDVLSIEKRSTAGMFPNAIRVTTLHSKYSFTSFLKRDIVYLKMSSLWESYLLLQQQNKSRNTWKGDDQGQQTLPSSASSSENVMHEDSEQPATRLIRSNTTYPSNINTPNKFTFITPTTSIIEPIGVFNHDKYQADLDVFQPSHEPLSLRKILLIMIFLLAVLWSLFVMSTGWTLERKIDNFARKYNLEKAWLISSSKHQLITRDELQKEIFSTIFHLINLKQKMGSILDLMNSFLKQEGG